MIRDDVQGEIDRLPSLSDDVRTAASYIRKKADWETPAPIPVWAVMLSPEFARQVAGWLDSYADTMEER